MSVLGDDLALLELDEEVATDGLLTFEEEAMRAQRTRSRRWKQISVAIAMGLGVAALSTHYSKSTTRFWAKGVTDFNLNEQEEEHELEGNHFCVEYMANVGCEWTKDWKCPGEATIDGQPAGKQGQASNDQSIGYHCCCQKDFYELPISDIKKAVHNGAGLTETAIAKMEKGLDGKESQEGGSPTSKLAKEHKLEKAAEKKVLKEDEDTKMKVRKVPREKKEKVPDDDDDSKVKVAPKKKDDDKDTKKKDDDKDTKKKDDDKDTKKKDDDEDSKKKDDDEDTKKKGKKGKKGVKKVKKDKKAEHDDEKE